MSQVPPSLWGLVEEHVQPPELAEVKRILGEAAVDLSLELRAEVEILEALLEEERKAVHGPGPAPRPTPFSLLAPPPPMRDLVRRELRQLLCGLHHKAALEGRDTAKAWARYNPKVLRFALGDPRDSIEDKQEDRLPGSPDLRSSQDLSAIKDCLNVTNIDQVIQRLRTLLKEECHALEREIQALQCRLEDVHSSAAESSLMMLEPTLAGGGCSPARARTCPFLGGSCRSPRAAACCQPFLPLHTPLCLLSPGPRAPPTTTAAGAAASSAVPTTGH
ncbi:coiled-coil domain-containing protein 24 isoform X3 [Dromiciops gliroides]|uniref:coiled-coil domain-containing protein 24 isoform X3 n=1 Tax=Dromiciops gliroides TaxID=33562 RepID=UPI001CC7123E|nr:coiled-coil domain-containing protein 24 isoform X3 [Dromiciops gliroides]